MPYVYAHEFCGERVLSLCTSPVFSLLSAHRAQFSLGCMGPDAWFYHNPLPWMPSSRADFGQRLHSDRIGDVFAAMLDAAMADDRERRFAYFAGYLCHYALDCAAHPYVTYKTVDPAYHTPFEAAIDIALLAARGETLRSRPLSSMIPPADPAPFAALHVAAARALGESIPPQICLQPPVHMSRFVGALRDLHGVKRALCALFERIVNKPGLLSDKLYTPRRYRGIDALNDSRALWKNPWNGTTHTESFADLMENAARRAASFADQLYLALFGDGRREETLILFADNSFDTGLHWQTQTTPLHGDCAFGAKHS